MVVVVNHLHLTVPLPREAFDALERTAPEMLANGCRGAEIIEVSDHHLILLLRFDDAAAAAEVSRIYGAPWMNEHVAPLLASPTERSVGEVVAS